MGEKFNFTCPGCGHTALVSGGRDMGMMAVVRTMTCEDCKELIDVRIGRYGKDGPTGDPNCDKDLDICPVCRGHNVCPWPSRHPCPQCGGAMTKDDDATILWD